MDTQTKSPVLYSFRRCPYAMRARMALFYSGVECELREVVLKSKPHEMLDISAKGTVPVLFNDGHVIDESIDIMRWALQQSDPDGWSEQNIEHPLVARNDGYFKSQLDSYKYFDGREQQSDEHTQNYYLEKACEFINELESCLSESTIDLPWLNGKAMSAVDVAIFPFVRQFAFVDKTHFDQLPYPRVQQWLAYLLGSDLFQSVMVKYPAWHAGQPPVLFSNNSLNEIEQ